jgi:hypothetical protein
MTILVLFFSEYLFLCYLSMPINKLMNMCYLIEYTHQEIWKWHSRDYNLESSIVSRVNWSFYLIHHAQTNRNQTSMTLKGNKLQYDGIKW